MDRGSRERSGRARRADQKSVCVIRPRRSRSAALDAREQVGRDAGGLAKPVDLRQDRARAIVRDERVGDAVVGDEAVLHRLLVVVLTREQQGAALRAQLGFRTVRRAAGVERLARAADAPRPQPALQFGIRHREDDRPERPAVHQRIERVGLADRAREAIEDESVRRVGLRQPVAHEVDHQVVTDQIPASMVALTRMPSSVRALTAARRMSPVEIAGTQ